MTPDAAGGRAAPRHARDLARNFPACRRSTMSISRWRRARSTRCSARTAPASRRCSRSCPAREKPDAGTIDFAGEAIALTSPHDAQKLGIVTIYQEFTLAPNMTVAENVFIGREPGTAALRQLAPDGGGDARHHRSASGSTSTRCGWCATSPSPSSRWWRSPARSPCARASSSWTSRPRRSRSSEVEKLFRIVRDMKAAGLSVIFVTHRLEEVMEICDRYTVLRDGRQVGERRGRRDDDRRHHPPDGRARGERALRASRGRRARRGGARRSRA